MLGPLPAGLICPALWRIEPIRRTLDGEVHDRAEALMSQIPDVLPVLSRGKHRSPKKGACFMEMASFLAGERWSDHPSCTHALLADVARNANDRTSDAGRPQLAPLIPSVIGLTTDDERADPRIALHCALVALPVASADRQRSLAVGVRVSQRMLATLGDAEGTEHARRVLAQVPHAAEWAARFAARSGADRHETTLRRYRRYAGPGIVNLAARGIAEAVVPDTDALLREMLTGAIEICQDLQPVAPEVDVDAARWQQACALTF